MKTRKLHDMHDPMDSYLRRGLKNWAVQKNPPENGRARLLLVASSGDGRYEASDKLGYGHGRSNSNRSDLRGGQASDPFNHAWLWVLHLTLNPIRHVT